MRRSLLLFVALLLACILAAVPTHAQEPGDAVVADAGAAAEPLVGNGEDQPPAQQAQADLQQQQQQQQPSEADAAADGAAALLAPVPMFTPATPQDQAGAPVPEPAVQQDAAADGAQQQQNVPVTEAAPAATEVQNNEQRLSDLEQQQQRMREHTAERLNAQQAAAQAGPTPSSEQKQQEATPSSPTEAQQPAGIPERSSRERRREYDRHRGHGGRNAHQQGPRGHEGHGHVSDPTTTRIQHGSHSHTVEDAEQHGGLIFGTTVGVMLLAQVGLFLWKKYALASFDKATVAGLWLFPMLYAVWHGPLNYWRLLTLWALFSVACGVVMTRALRKPVARTTPRQVYSFFYWLYRGAYATAAAGYAVVMIHFMGLSFLPLLPSPATAALLLFYGLYFGVLGRDLANVTSTSLAVNMGYVAHKGEMPRKMVPPNVCALCDGELVRSFRPVGGSTAPPPEEKVHKLNCGHQFHDFCLRGWNLIGKRDTCASCSEKVKLRDYLRGPWEQTSVAWSVLLDMLRYLLVFNPIVVLAAQFVLYIVY